MKWLVMFVAMSCATICSSSAMAASIELNPTQDALTYQFQFAGPGTPAMKGFYPSHLVAGYSGLGHNMQSLLMFDTASTGLTPADIDSATLRLFVVSSSVLPPPAIADDPSATSSITVNVAKLSAAPTWTENAVKWTNAPAATGGPIDSSLVNTTGTWIDFDVKSLVVDWLTTPAGNNGLTVYADALRVVGSNGNAVMAIFTSINGDAQEPQLVIETVEAEAVPEPSTVLLGALAAAGAFACVVRRRCKARAVGR